MILFKLMIILLLILTFVYLRNFFLKLIRNKKSLKAKKLKIFNKENLNNWMNLNKKERYNLLKQENTTYLDKRKLLLEEIRKEYKKISKGNSEKNLKDE